MAFFSRDMLLLSGSGIDDGRKEKDHREKVL
jgi:hypothetical protein